ncbi:hypothetical protein BKA69DRAFT_1067458 [Paraphysoderma sedebokerense]|nr:hypothetical protein BKA69DRAFT_1067458 [Paraphysoderma sedebokerense]
MNDFPIEVLTQIFEHLGPHDRISASFVSKTWRVVTLEAKALTLQATPSLSRHTLSKLLNSYHRLTSLTISLSTQSTSSSKTLLNTLFSICSQFKGHQNLKYLESDTDLIIPGALKCKNLRVLKLNGNYIPISGNGESPSELQSQFQNENINFDLSGDDSEFRLGNRKRDISLILAKLPKLQELEISNAVYWNRHSFPDNPSPSNNAMNSSTESSELTPVQVETPKSQLTSLTIRSIPAWALTNLMNAIGKNVLPELRDFKLESDLHLPGKSIEKLKKGCPKLGVLEFEHVKMGPLQLFEICGYDDSGDRTAKGVKMNLEKLGLSYCEFFFCRKSNMTSQSSEECERMEGCYFQLLKLLTGRIPGLKSLELIHCEMSTVDISSNSALTDLVQSTLDDQEKSIQENRHRKQYKLKELVVYDLSNSHITKHDLIQIALRFPDLTSIKVHLSYQDLREQSTWIRHLGNLKNLTELELRCRESLADGSDANPLSASNSIQLRCPNRGDFMPKLSYLACWIPPIQSHFIFSTLLPISSHLQTFIVNYPSRTFVELIEQSAKTAELRFTALRHLEIRVLGTHSHEIAESLVLNITKYSTSLRKIHVAALYYKQIPLSKALVQHLTKTVKRLESFEIQGFRFTQDLFEEMMSYWNDTLRKVEITGAAIEELDLEFDEVLGQFLEHHKLVKSLTLGVEKIDIPFSVLNETVSRMGSWLNFRRAIVQVAPKRATFNAKGSDIDRVDSGIDTSDSEENEEDFDNDFEDGGVQVGMDVDEELKGMNLRQLEWEKRKKYEMYLKKKFWMMDEIFVWSKSAVKSLAR